MALLGDACHPITPRMAQGASPDIEDAAVLSRCLAGVEPVGIQRALLRYELSRKERTSWIQLTSRQNTWARERTDPSWSMGMMRGMSPSQRLENEMGSQQYSHHSPLSPD